MTASNDDWRLHGQWLYLFGAVLHQSKYRTISPEWDHDHCAFCWAKFMESADEPDTLHIGYTTDDDYHWICTQCFEDFQTMFQFTLSPRIAFDR